MRPKWNISNMIPVYMFCNCYRFSFYINCCAVFCFSLILLFLLFFFNYFYDCVVRVWRWLGNLWLGAPMKRRQKSMLRSIKRSVNNICNDSFIFLSQSMDGHNQEEILHHFFETNKALRFEIACFILSSVVVTLYYATTPFLLCYL